MANECCVFITLSFLQEFGLQSQDIRRTSTRVSVCSLAPRHDGQRRYPKQIATNDSSIHSSRLNALSFPKRSGKPSRRNRPGSPLNRSSLKQRQWQRQSVSPQSRYFQNGAGLCKSNAAALVHLDSGNAICSDSWLQEQQCSSYAF